jgi:hypothetical protein
MPKDDERITPACGVRAIAPFSQYTLTDCASFGVHYTARRPLDLGSIIENRMA